MKINMDSDRLRLIDLANKSFGEYGWSFSISNVTLDFTDKNSSGHHVVGTSAVVRVQLPNGTFREDIGYGSGTGPIKSEVIYKTKMDAVTMGLHGALACFGGDFVKKLNPVHPVTPLKGLNEMVSSSAHLTEKPLPKTSSPEHTISRPFTSTKNIVDGPSTSGVPLKASVTVSATSPVMASKPFMVHTQNTSVPHKSPLAKPLPQTTCSNNSQLSEEERERMKRKERQRLLQEEFQRKRNLQQAQDQAKAQGKPLAQVNSQSRMPLKEQQELNHQSRGANSAVLDGDDDKIMSTQELATMVEIAANATANASNISKRSPIVSSPSIARSSSVSEPRIQAPQTRHGQQKRPDLSNFAFHSDKKPRGQY